MDEKTEQLRDIFMDVADESTVTDRQESARGSLAREGSTAERTADTVETMAERDEFATDLPVATLVAVVAGFYAGDTDAALADAIEESRHTVFRARMDLHLVRESDTDAPFDLDTLRDRLGDDTAAIATDLDAAESTVRRCRRVVETQVERRAVGDRFRETFDEIYLDADLSTHTDDVTRDGLDEATEDSETDLPL